jgi:hypothetical protein
MGKSGTKQLKNIQISLLLCIKESNNSYTSLLKYFELQSLYSLQ